MDAVGSRGDRTCSRHPGKDRVTACYIVLGDRWGACTQHGTLTKTGLRRVTNPTRVVKGLRPITYQDTKTTTTDVGWYPGKHRITTCYIGSSRTPGPRTSDPGIDLFDPMASGPQDLRPKWAYLGLLETPFRPSQTPRDPFVHLVSGTRHILILFWTLLAGFRAKVVFRLRASKRLSTVTSQYRDIHLKASLGALASLEG